MCGYQSDGIFFLCVENMVPFFFACMCFKVVHFFNVCFKVLLYLLCVFERLYLFVCVCKMVFCCVLQIWCVCFGL